MNDTLAIGLLYRARLISPEGGEVGGVVSGGGLPGRWKT